MYPDPDNSNAPAKKTARLNFVLKDIWDENERPLEEVFFEALDRINTIGKQPGELEPEYLRSSVPYKANWLARLAIRAVCEAIVAKGTLPMPLAVEMHWKNSPGSGENLPCAVIREELRQLARKHGANERFLAAMAMEEFVGNHWHDKSLVFKTSYPMDPNEVLNG